VGFESTAHRRICNINAILPGLTVLDVAVLGSELDLFCELGFFSVMFLKVCFLWV
jgi:hypothetical protein